MPNFNKYRQWNKALFSYFFPTRTEDAVLYIDGDILKQIGTKANIVKPQNQTWEDCFLSSTLLTNETYSQFSGSWTQFKGNVEVLRKVRTWDGLVEGLSELKFNDDTPAYFAMLCSIMLLASLDGAKHADIQKRAQSYLGANYAGKPGQLVDTLLQQLHKDIPYFNADNMLCGTQRNMSRMKYHLVLKKELRDDFIDLLEIYNLKWGYEPYQSFVDNHLIPVLDKANKKELLDFVIKEENIAYIKNILRKDLNYGKPVKDSINNNSIQERIVKWKYGFEFDYNGYPCFFMLSDNDHYPFNISFNESEFNIQEDLPFDEVIADNTTLEERLPFHFQTSNGTYKLENVCEDVTGWESLFFERVTENYYLQVEEPQNGKDYIALIKRDNKKIIEPSWSRTEDVHVPNYCSYDIFGYTPGKIKKDAKRTSTEDSHQLHRVGSWFSIILKPEEELFWKPNRLGSEPEKIPTQLQGRDGKQYFRIRPSNCKLISGVLTVQKGKDIILPEKISYKLQWDNESILYKMNGWGEIGSFEMPNPSSNNKNSGIHVLQYNLSDKTEGSDILLQILFDIADSKGCISSRDMACALNFALAFHGITPTPDNRKSVIYALKRLGYLTAYYDIQKKEYINQLIPKYVEKSDYSINGYASAYLLKGVYSIEDYHSLVGDSGSGKVYRKRPFDSEAIQYRPEYACLPDMILIDINGKISWRRFDFQISDYLISIMENMSSFEKKFKILENGDTYTGEVKQPAPCMVSDSHGHEILCTKSSSGSYLTHRYFYDGTHQRLIPRQLARVYTQINKKHPVCLLNWNQVGRTIDFARLSFTKGMGIPDVLDIALCDSNLGLPTIEKVFIVDQKKSLGINISPITERRIYTTNATNTRNTVIMEAVSKLSGRSVTNLIVDSEVVFFARSANRHFRMEQVRQYSNKKDLILLYYSTDLLAFAIGKDVYYNDTRSNCFRKVESEDANEAISIIFKNDTQNLKLGDTYKGVVPKNIDKSRILTIPIIDRQRINTGEYHYGNIRIL